MSVIEVCAAWTLGWQAVQVHVLTICGSLRDGSANAVLLGRFASLLGTADEVTRSVSTGDVPQFRPDIDASDAVVRLRAQIAAADAVVIATPEYAHSLPGSLKNALDWMVGSGELYEKPVAIVAASNAPNRGALGRSALEQTLRAQGSAIVDSRTVLTVDAAVQDATTAQIAEIVELLRAATA